MTENEKWFDEEVAPKLIELCKQCQSRGIPFLAQAEYNSGEFSLTASLGEHPDLAMSILYMAAMSKTNIDGLIIGIIRHCSKRGIDISSSIMLSRFSEREAAGG